MTCLIEGTVVEVTGPNQEISANTAARRPYFRRDQKNGISPPDLSKNCTYAEHIVHARGKRTQFTSVSLDPNKLRDIGDTTYRLHREDAARDGHGVVEHEALLDELRRVAREEDKAARLRAVHALRYARLRREGIVQWKFQTEGVERKDLISWADGKVQPYFSRV